MGILQDTKFIRMISRRLEKFQDKGSNVFCFRCPVCGDSEKDKNKTRGYFYPYKQHMNMKCHNCGGLNNGVVSFSRFLQWFDSELYKDYLVDIYGEREPRKKVIKVDKMEEEYKLKKKPIMFAGEEVEDNSIFSNIIPIADLPVYHYCREYVKERMIPEKWYPNLFFAEDFKAWVNTWKPGKFSEDSLKRDCPRLVIALNNENGWTIAVQGRDLTGESFLKYYSIKVADEEETCFGLDQFDFSKRGYILEGPIDSMFIPNALGSGSSALKVPTKYRTKIKDFVYVYDNEPRNKDIVKIIGRAVRAGHKVYLPPVNAPYKKDINDWVMDTGITGEEITKFIDENTHQGLEAELYFNRWKKV